MGETGPFLFDRVMPMMPMMPMMKEELKQRIDAIEESYEFMLAYAAKGLPGEAEGSSGQVRDYLKKADLALQRLADLFRAHVRDHKLAAADQYEAFIDVLERDARGSRAAIQLVLAQPSISSQLVDNLNASIHLRALLTDLFLIDEALKSTARASKPMTSS